jgi:hypothetical protein
MKETGLMIKLMVKELTPTLMEQGMSVSGQTTSRMAEEPRSGLMDRHTQVNTKTLLSTVI